MFVHELAHVFAARQFGMRVQSVTLHLLGGETLIEGESRTPWQELWISISGPLTSLGIGVSSLDRCPGSMDGTTSDILWSVGYVNILVAIFNMLPGLPLDGGRVFRAIIWQVTGREEIGVRIAAWIGRAAAVGVVAFALLNRDGDNQLGVNLAIALLVAWFLWQGASDALRQRQPFVAHQPARRSLRSSTPSNRHPPELPARRRPSRIRPAARHGRPSS